MELTSLQNTYSGAKIVEIAAFEIVACAFNEDYSGTLKINCCRK